MSAAARSTKASHPGPGANAKHRRDVANPDIIYGSITEGVYGEDADIGTLTISDVDDPTDTNHDFTNNILTVDKTDIFEISGNILRLKDGVSLDRDVQQAIEVTVTATDANNSNLKKQVKYILDVGDANEAPTDIDLTNLAVVENSDNTTDIATITVEDTDDDGTLFDQHQLAVDDNRFEVVTVGGVHTLRLRAGETIDFEVDQNINIVITATDMNGAAEGKSYFETFTLNTQDVNEAVTGISLANLVSVNENNFKAPTIANRPAQKIADVNVSDIDLASQEFGQHSVSVNDSRFFVNTSGELWLKAGAEIDFETEATITLELIATDNPNDATDQNTSAPVEFVISVQDLTDNWNLYQHDGVTSEVLDNNFSGAQGDDIILAGVGNDTVHGGDGNDIIYGGNDGDVDPNDAIQPLDADGYDVLYGEAGNDQLYGGSNEDILRGGTGDDTIHGGAGRDIIFGDVGADSLDGGDGEDTVDYSESTSGVNLNLFNSTVNYVSAFTSKTLNLTSGGHTGYAAGDSYSSIEHVQGTDYDDNIIGDQFKNRILGGLGNDTLSGGDDDDDLRGGAGNDYIDGENGNDRLDGWTGDDILIGGNDDDKYVVTRISGEDSIYNADFTTNDDSIIFTKVTIDDYKDQLSESELVSKTDAQVLADFNSLYSADDQADIEHKNLWFTKDLNDLVVNVVGSSSKTIIKDWYSTAQDFKVSVFRAGAKISDEINVNSLVTLMAGTTLPGDQVSMDSFIAANQSDFDAAWANDTAPILVRDGVFTGYGENDPTGSTSRKIRIQITDDQLIDINNFTFKKVHLLFFLLLIIFLIY